MPDRHLQKRSWPLFVSGIELNFPIGLFTYKCHGILDNWTVLFCMGRGHTKNHCDFIGAYVEAIKHLPPYLSCQKTNDIIDTTTQSYIQQKKKQETM